jgi:phosphate transport system permease protein
MSAVLEQEPASPDTAESVTPRERLTDRMFRGMSHGFAWLTIALVVYIVVQIAFQAIPAMSEYGLSFLISTTWDKNQGAHGVYGILPQILGTLYTSLLALAIGTIFGVAVAVFLNEGFLSSFVFSILQMFHVQFHPWWGKLPDVIESVLKNLVQLLAAIPSVVYGLWGIFVVIPLIRPACNWLSDGMPWMPFFGSELGDKGLLPASIVLAIMILPTIAAISQDALAAVPPRIREASYGLGATRWETILAVILPTAAPGVYGAVILAFGRALGETMALAMLAGGSNKISLSVFAPVDTLAALLANSFPEADKHDAGVLMYAALVLLAITLVVNMLGTVVLNRATAQIRGAQK